MMAMTASAQKFALIDMDYILKNIPAYERANEQLNQVSKKWQAEVDALKNDEKGAAFAAPFLEFPLSGKLRFTLPEL